MASEQNGLKRHTRVFVCDNNNNVHFSYGIYVGITHCVIRDMLELYLKSSGVPLPLLLPLDQCLLLYLLKINIFFLQCVLKHVWKWPFNAFALDTATGGEYKSIFLRVVFPSNGFFPFS